MALLRVTKEERYQDLMKLDKTSLVNLIFDLERQLYVLKRGKFGNYSNSETTDALNKQTNCQLELEFFTDEEKKATEEEIAQIKSEQEKTTTVVKEHTRKNRSCTNVDVSNLPVETTVLDPFEINDDNRDDYVLIGTESTRTIEVQPRRVYIKEIIRNNYVLKSTLQYQGSELPTFFENPVPVEIFPKCMASASIFADIIVLKYLYHMPFYRVCQMYKESGLIISSSTINDWFENVCDLLRPAYNEIWKKVLSQKYIHCDETFAKIYDTEKKKNVTGNIWALCDGIGGNAVFIYENGKKNTKAANNILGSYEGALQTDCNVIYDKYDNFPNITTIGCWVHCRRYWTNALIDDLKTAEKAIALIDKLYSIEHDAIVNKLTSEQRYELRQKESLKILNTLKDWLNQLNLSQYAKKSPTLKAISYTTAHFDKLKRCFDNGDYSLDNNKIEGLIRPIKVGLNSYKYFHNGDAAYRSSIMYTLIATCDGNDVNPREWLEDILPKLVGIDYSTKEGKAKVVALLPDEWKKTHPNSHTPISHMTEEEHIQKILRSRSKRAKEATEKATTEKVTTDTEGATEETAKTNK